MAVPLTSQEEWVRRGVDEYVSVGSFNRFSLDLLRSGAPADLVATTQRAAMEEVTHAQLSFALAKRFSSEDSDRNGLVPAPRGLEVPHQLPLSESAAELALKAFTEGCLGEYMASVKVSSPLCCDVRLLTSPILDCTVYVLRDVQTERTHTHTHTHTCPDDNRHDRLSWSCSVCRLLVIVTVFPRPVPRPHARTWLLWQTL